MPTDRLAQESRVPRKHVCKKVEKDAIDHAFVKEIAKSDDSKNALNGPIELLKDLMKGYKYKRSEDGKISYATHPHYFQSPCW